MDSRLSHLRRAGDRAMESAALERSRTHAPRCCNDNCGFRLTYLWRVEKWVCSKHGLHHNVEPSELGKFTGH